MGQSILDLVIGTLEAGGFQAEAAFDGQKYPAITRPVAAVHLDQVDRESLKVTLGVNIICPAGMGGTRCELEGLRAMELLRAAGGSCVQGGCSYDGLVQAYVVKILTTFVGRTGADACALGPGFRIFLEDLEMPWAVAFQSERVRQVNARYEMDSESPAGFEDGVWLWHIRLEELIPLDREDSLSMEGAFQLWLSRGDMDEVYTDCRWTQIRREYTREGLRKISTGVSLLRREEVNVEAEV